VSELLYSGFLEHVGRCIYGGIVDSPKHPSPAKLLETTDHGDEVSKGRLGWRKDVVDLIGKKGDLEVPMLRWPGGELLLGIPVLSRPDPHSFPIRRAKRGTIEGVSDAASVSPSRSRSGTEWRPLS
jgi:hypothetical protein